MSNQPPSSPSSQVVEAPSNGRGRPRGVSFDTTNQVTIIPDDRPEVKAYTQDEILTFKQNAALDVQRLRQHLASANNEAESDGNDEQILYHFIGLEDYVSQARVRNLLAARRAHVVAVLWEQLSQVRGEVDVDRLASVSTSSSRSARVRAEQMAAGYMNLGG